MTPTPILTIRLLDIALDRDITTRKLLLLGAKDLAKEHKSKFKKMDISPKIFHNTKIQYSGIQLGIYQGSPEWTAIGRSAVKALKLWYSLFRKENEIALQNTQWIKEKYTPEFFSYQKKYKIKTLLISSDLAELLEVKGDKYTVYDRLEKYLYGNIQRFFRHIDYEHNKDVHFLKITIQDAHVLTHSKYVFRNKKKIGYEVTFLCNLRLPQMIRMGQSTALGYGKVFHIQRS